MLRYFIAIVLSVCAFAVSAAGYTVEQVPNVHLADSTRFVTNPDGVLSPRAEAQLNDMLRTLMRETSAEVLCVAVDNIDESRDIDTYATELFRTWGIGKKDKNNGLLLLIAKDQHRFVFRTGNGLEGLLPDGLLGSITRRQMIPRFKENDYDGGTIAALSDVCGILSSPEARQEVMSKYENNAREGHGGSMFRLYMYLCAFLAIGCLGWVIITGWRSSGLKRFDRYQEADKLYTPLLFASFIGLGLPLVAFVIVALWRHRLRRGTHLCPDCHTKMNLVDEEHDNDYLQHSQDIEERIGAVDYDVWLCPKCGETEIIPYVQKSSAFTECPVCKARTFHVVSDRTVKQPTTHSTGLRVVTYRCVNCGFEDTDNHTLPKVTAAPPIIILPGGGGGRGGFGGGGFGGGSLGGGTTSGGGVSGGW